jgi:O-antigen/teichoic acid export membrane protein
VATAEIGRWASVTAGGSFQRFKTSALARNTAWMMAGSGVRLLIQAVYFVVIARTLGPREYGAFVGAAALIAFVAPFATLGFGNLLVRNGSLDRHTLRESLGNALAVSGCAGLVLIVAVTLVGELIFGHTVPLRLIATIAISDLFLATPLMLATQAFQAIDRLDRTAQLHALSSGARLLCAIGMAALNHSADATYWGYLYAGATAVTSAIAVVWLVAVMGAPRFGWVSIRRDVREGLYFSLSLSAQNTYNDIDKTMLTRMSSLNAVGIYAAAYRLVDVAFVPVRSLMAAAYPNYFREGANGLHAAFLYARRLLPVALMYAVAIAVAAFMFAPVIPRILGSDYSLTVEALRWLALLPFMKTLQCFIADALTGAGYQGRRSALQAGTAILNVVLNIWFIPLWSWRGAAWSSLLSDGLFALMLWITIHFTIRQQGRATGRAVHA